MDELIRRLYGNQWSLTAVPVPAQGDEQATIWYMFWVEIGGAIWTGWASTPDGAITNAVEQALVHFRQAPISAPEQVYANWCRSALGNRTRL